MKYCNVYTDNDVLVYCEQGQGSECELCIVYSDDEVLVYCVHGR